MVELIIFFQFFFSGLTSGCIYALTALGFVLCYNVSKVLNFGLGEYVALGGLIVAALVASGTPLFLALLIAMVLGALVGLVQERLTLAPVRTAPGFIVITITLGVSIALRGLFLIIFGKDPLAMEPFTGSKFGGFGLFGSVLPWQTLWVWGLTVIALAATFGFLKFTRLGRAVRAVSNNLRAAYLMGIHAERISSLTYAASGFLGAVGGFVIAPMVLANWSAGIDFGMKGFMGAVIGNLRNPGTAVLGGLAVGVLEQLAAGYISSGSRDIIVYAAFLLFLMVRGGVFARGREDLTVERGF